MLSMNPIEPHVVFDSDTGPRLHLGIAVAEKGQLVRPPRRKCIKIEFSVDLRQNPLSQRTFGDGLALGDGLGGPKWLGARWCAAL